MGALQRIWEIVTFLSSGLVSLFETLVTSVVGSANARHLKQLEPKVTAVNDLEPGLPGDVKRGTEAADNAFSESD